MSEAKRDKITQIAVATQPVGAQNVSLEDSIYGLTKSGNLYGYNHVLECWVLKCFSPFEDNN